MTNRDDKRFEAALRAEGRKMPGAYDLPWIHRRLKQVAEEAKRWPAWYRNQPLTSEDAKRMTQDFTDNQQELADIRELALLRAENEALKAVLLSRHGGEPLALLSELDEARQALATERAAREAAEEDVVWAGRNTLASVSQPTGLAFSRGGKWLIEDYDGTDAGLRAAIRRARLGGDGNASM